MRRTTRRWAAGAVAAVLVAGLGAVPVGADDKLPWPTRNELMASQNNLKQIALAFHNYAATYKDALPGDLTAKDGKPLLSWRVAILPFVEEAALYKQFKLDEPWDSANNKPLAAKMPKIYAPIRVKAKEGETFYQTFTGPGTVFDPQPKFKIGNMPDGTSNTGMVFEAGEPVIWSKPADLAFDEKKPLPKLGGLFEGDFSVAMFDGSVRRIKKDADEGELKKLIMPADGQVIDFKKLDK